MNKTVKIILGIILLILLVFALKYFKDSNAKEVVDYKTELPFYSSLDTKTVATGKLNPEEEIELKPQISGIVDQIFVEEGDLVRKGDLIAKIRVVPNAKNMSYFKQPLLFQTVDEPLQVGLCGERCEIVTMYLNLDISLLMPVQAKAALKPGGLRKAPVDFTATIKFELDGGRIPFEQNS